MSSNIHRQIQAVHARQNDTQVVFGDDMFVTINLEGVVSGAGIGDGDSPRLTIARGGDESIRSFAERCVDDAGNLAYLAQTDLEARFELAMDIATQTWIADKRLMKFGPRAS